MIVLYPSYSFESLSTDRDDAEANQLLSAWSALFHPVLLEKSGHIPRWESASGGPYEVHTTFVLVPPCCEELLPADWIARQEERGVPVLRNFQEREEIIGKLFERLEINDHGFDEEYVADFLALGTAYFLTDMLVRHLRYMSMLDDTKLSTAAFDSIKAYREGDREKADERLKDAFETVSQSKEYFYPTQSYLLDLLLVTPKTTGEAFRKILAEQETVNLFLSCRDLITLQQENPESFAALKSACDAGKVRLIGDDLVGRLPPGGDVRYSAQNPSRLSPTLPPGGGQPTIPLLDIVHRIRSGQTVYRDLLGITPKIYGRLKTGLTPFHPQLLRLLGVEGAIHFAPLDGWKLNEHTQSKMIWKGVDGTTIDALIRYPMNASSHEEFFDLPTRLGQVIDNDHAATAVFARFPGQKARWLEDLLRMDRHAQALGKFSGIDEYFADTPHSGTVQQLGFGKYSGNALSEAVRNDEADPISRWVELYADHAGQIRQSALVTLLAMFGEPSGGGGGVPPTPPALCECFAEAICGPTSGNTTAIFLANPWSWPRRMFLDVSDWSALPAEESPVILARQNDKRKEIVVDVPLMGYAVVEKPVVTENDKQPSPKRKNVPFLAALFGNPVSDPTIKSVKPLIEKHEQKLDTKSTRTIYRLQNEFFEANVDATIGLLRSLFTNEHRNNRLSMQLGFRMPKELRKKDERDLDNPNRGYAGMAVDDIHVERAGPITGRLRIAGRLVCPDGFVAATIVEALTVRRTSRIIELDIELSPVMEPGDSPWDSYYAIRTAWNDNTLDVRGGIGSGSHLLTADILQAPQFIDLRGEKTSLTLLTGGLPFHRKFGETKLDTILIAKGETARKFRFGIGVDVAYPVPASLEFLDDPEQLVRQVSKIPKNPASWLFQVGAKNVIALHWEPIFDGDNRIGLRVFLLETEGRRAHFPLRSFRLPKQAVKQDLLGNTVKELKVDDDAVLIDMHGHELLPLAIYEKFSEPS